MFNKAFVEALADHFRRQGPKVIERVAKNHPAAYLKICALLVPRDVQVEHKSAISSLTDEQLEAAIAAIRESLAARAEDAAAKAQTIEGGLAPPALPKPGD